MQILHVYLHFNTIPLAAGGSGNDVLSVLRVWPRKSVWGSKDGHGVPEMEVKGFGWVHCEEPEMSVKDLRLV